MNTLAELLNALDDRGAVIWRVPNPAGGPDLLGHWPGWGPTDRQDAMVAAATKKHKEQLLAIAIERGNEADPDGWFRVPDGRRVRPSPAADGGIEWDAEPLGPVAEVA